MKRVSILIPLYNCEEFISDCIEKILSQTYRNINVLISDDCSSDKSFVIAKEYESKDNRIRVFKQEINLGYLGNYNFLLQQADGEYIAIQDSDDWSDPERIEEQVAVLDANSDILICGVSCTFHYPNSSVTVRGRGNRLISGPSLDYGFVPASIMFRKSNLSKVPSMNIYFEGGTSMDRYFINEILSYGNGYHIDMPLYHARIRPNSNHKSLSHFKIFTNELVKELIKQRMDTGTDWLKENRMSEIEKYKEKILSNSSIISEAYRQAAVFDIQFGNYGEAYRKLKLSLSKKVTTVNLRTLIFLIRKKISNYFSN